MAPIAAQRCANHPAREAAARCPACGGFFCRECLTEHDERVICAACLKKIAQPGSAPHRRRSLWPALQGAAGLFVAWLVFYSIGRMLLALPDSFHESTLWQPGLFDADSEEK